MCRIERPTVRANIGSKAMPFDVILTAFVVRFTQALQLAQAEAGVIAINAFDVVGDLGRHDSPFGQAHGA